MRNGKAFSTNYFSVNLLSTKCSLRCEQTENEEEEEEEYVYDNGDGDGDGDDNIGKKAKTFQNSIEYSSIHRMIMFWNSLFKQYTHIYGSTVEQ